MQAYWNSLFVSGSWHGSAVSPSGGLGRQRPERTDAVDDKPGAPERLPVNLMQHRIAIAHPHQAAPAVRAVYIRAVHGIDAECYHIPRFCKTRNGVFQAPLGGRQVRRDRFPIHELDVLELALLVAPRNKAQSPVLFGGIVQMNYSIYITRPFVAVKRRVLVQ